VRQIELLCGDAASVLRTLPAGIARTCITSPPYWGLRNYQVEGQMGLEATVVEYVERLVAAMREVRRVLADDGTLWLVLGDRHASGARKSEGFNARWHGKHYLSDKQGAADRERPTRSLVAGTKSKDLLGLPWLVAFALRGDGWYLRSDVVWEKPNAMPESVVDRPTMSHEHVFLLAKSHKYYYDADAIREPYDGVVAGNPKGRNKRDVWRISTRPFKGAHFAVFPSSLVEPCVGAGSALGDLVLDPFVGSGTVGVVALGLGRRFLGIDLNPEYVEMARRRIEASIEKDGS